VSHPGIAAAFLLAALLLGAAVVIVYVTEVDAKTFWEDAVGALLAVAGGVIITGAVG
jgi:hypothetical protein